MTGTGEDGRPAIDPRHDAIYQRGYQSGGETPASRRLVESSSLPQARDERVDGLGEPDAVTVDADDFQDELPRPGWNPFIMILWVVAVLFPAAGISLQLQNLSSMYTSTSYSGVGEVPISLVLQQLSYLVAQPLITVGLLAVAGLLFWHAAAWRARRLSRPEES